MSADLLPLPVAAARAGVHQRTLRRHAPELPVVRIGRRRLVRAVDLDVWIASRVAAPVPVAAPGAQLSDAAKRFLGRLERSVNGPHATQPRDNAQPDPLTADQRGRR